MTEQEDLERIRQRIKIAREYIKEIMGFRAKVANIASGLHNVGSFEVEFPDPDIAYVYQCMFGHRSSGAIVYRLSFGETLKWIGVSHPFFGVKPADIPVPEQ